jgi:hypothetical protein
LIDIVNYNACRGVYSPLHEHNNIIYGFWLCGQNYKNASPYYGSYPPSYLSRMSWLFPHEENILHMFSGMVTKGHWKTEHTLDINESLHPDWCMDVIDFCDVAAKCTLDVIFADPPYDDNHIKYGTEKLNKKKVIKRSVELLKIGGYLVWLDTIIPIWAKADGWKLRGTIGMVQSTNHKCRVITILEKIS